MGFWNLQAFNLLCWRNKLGESLPIQAPLLHVFLRQDIFPLVTSLVQCLAPPYPTLGEAFSIAWVLLERVPSGMWAMENKFIYGTTNGSPSTHKVISPPISLPIYPMVSSLIDPATKWWRTEMIRSAFLPFKADAILKIPLSRSLPDDKLIHCKKCISYCPLPG